MDRKSKVNNQSGSDSKRNGYQQHSRGGDVMQDIKKNNKDEEESYYEGTSKVKRERQRKPRQTNSTPSLLSSGFTQSATTGPPPVNAWQQKKGSALFVKPEEEFVGDEEDYMLRQALEESIRTAENEKKNRELMDMYNYGEASSSQANDQRVLWGNKPDEKSQCRFDKEIKKPDPHLMNTANPSSYVPSSRRSNQVGRSDFNKSADSSDDSLSYKKPNSTKQPVQTFVDKTDSGEDLPYPNRTQPKNISMSKKSYSPQEKIAQPMYTQQNETKSKPEIYQSDLSTDYSDDEEDNFESSNNEFEAMNDSVNFKANKVHDPKHNSPENDFTSSVVKPIQEKKENVTIDDLSKGMRNALTFGDTEGLLDDLQDSDHFQFSDRKSNYSFGSSRFEPNPLKGETKTGISPNSAFPSSVETDELLHSFIRKDPPSTLANSSQASEFDRNPMYAAGGTNQFLVRESVHQHNLLGDGSLHPGLAKTNDLDSSSPLSNSPSQNTPFGSFENQLLAGMASNMQVQRGHFQYPLNFLPSNGSNIQNPLANQTIMSQLSYPNVPPGYGVSNLTNPLLTQLGAANPNMIPGLSEANPLLAQMSVTSPNMIPSLDDSRNNLPLLQAMNQNLSALENPAADPTNITSLGNTVPNQNPTPSRNDMAQNPIINPGVTTTNPNLGPLAIGSMANYSDPMSFIGANNPALDPVTLAALTSQTALLNMATKVNQTPQFYHAQMMANYNYYARLQYQAQLAALAGNVELNEDSGQDQTQSSFQFNQAQVLPKEVPKQQFPVPENSSQTAMDNHAKGIMPPSLQNQVQPNQASLDPVHEQVTQPNTYFSDYQTQASLQNQAQVAQNDEYLKLELQILSKKFSALQQALQNKGDNKSAPTPMPVSGQANVPIPSMLMTPQYPVYPTGQFLPAPVMGIHGYYPMMPTANVSQTSPNTQQGSSLFTMPSNNESSLGNARQQ